MVQKIESPAGASFEDLASEADDLGAGLDEGKGGPVQLAPEKPDHPTNAQVIAGAIAAGRDAFCMFTKLESPKRQLTEPRILDLAAAWAKVADKYNVDLYKLMGDYGPEFAALFVTWQIAQDLRAGVRAEIAAREKKPDAAAPAGQGEPFDDAAANVG